jgi:radical SAM PhpK family P-methyltransferase
MKKEIDCLFIGHNEMEFVKYEQKVRKMGIHSGAYRDLNMNYVLYNDTPYSASDIFNLFYINGDAGDDLPPLTLGETFSPAIAYLGTYLNRRGFSFDYVNSFQEQKDQLAWKLENQNILAIAIITTLYVSVFPIMEIMEFIKRYNRQARVIIGGPFVSSNFRQMDAMSLEYLLKNIGADIYVISPQGEATLVDILEAMQTGKPLASINNIYYKYGTVYETTPFVEENNDLSDNMVNWDLFADQVGEYASVRTSISCPFSCAFCGFPQHAGHYRTSTLEAVERELDRLADIKSIKSITFIDDTFNVPVKRFKQILHMMIKNDYRFNWNSHFRSQFADRETVTLMKESGCEGVFLGIESGSNQILENMNKAATVEQYLKGIALLKEYGILTYGSFIIGFPGETEETIKDTVQFIKEGGLDFYRVQLWYCDPLTPIWEKKDEYHINGSNFEWSHATMDSRRACDIIEDIFMTLKNSIWIPQYNFECDGLFHLIHRGFSLDELKEFLNYFNRGVKEKLLSPFPRDMSVDTVMQLKRACQINRITEGIGDEEYFKIDRAEVGFDF